MLAQRDYIDLFHTAVKALRQDYAGAKDKRALDRPNPHTGRMNRATLDGLGFDSTFVANMNAYLAGFKDKQLHLNINPDLTSYKQFSRGYYVRRCEDGLFVTLCPQSAKFHVGDQILRLSEFSIPMLVKMFGASLYGMAPERELWSGLLKMYKTVTVRHANGSEEIIEQEKFTTPETWANHFELLDADTAYLRLEDFSETEKIRTLLADHQAEIVACKKLIVDLRRTQGMDENATVLLLPYLFPTPVSPAQILCFESIQTNYTRHNCDLLKERLIGMLPKVDSDNATWIRELCAELDAKSGSGMQEHPDEIPDEWEDPLPTIHAGYEVVLLTDTYCRGVAEALVARCREAGAAKIIGRPTMGDLGYCHPVIVKLDEAFSLTYPITRTIDADRYAACGVPVDVYIPWTPEELTTDILLQAAQK